MIPIKSAADLAVMAEAGQRLSAVMKILLAEIEAGLINTLAIDQRAEYLLAERQSRPAFKGYRDYPSSICLSINQEVVHGIPDRHKELQSGDLISLDIGLEYQGFFADMTESLVIGGPVQNPAAARLITVARQSLALAIRQAQVGKTINDVSRAIQKHVEHSGFGVVRELVGHGIGRSLHEEPQVPNYVSPGPSTRLEAGMVLAIEPMITAGDWHVVTRPDGWTVETKDRSLAAHVERTVAITSAGPQILTPLTVN